MESKLIDKNAGAGLLIYSLREEDPAANTARLSELTDSEWEDVSRAAIHFGLLPLLYGKLAPFIKDIRMPAGIEENLRRAYLHSAVRNMRLYGELSKFLKTLKDEGILVIPLKGAYLAEAVYGNIALRPMGDVDLLVRKEDFAKAVELLISRGCKADTTARPEDVFATHQHYPPLKAESGLSIEIHWTLTPPELNARIKAEDIWCRAKPVVIADVEVLALSPEDLIVHLSIHTVLQHSLGGRLRPLFDIARTIQFCADDINWSAVRHIAGLWEAERSVYLALALAAKYTGISAPEDFMAHIKPEDDLPEIFEIAETVIFDCSHLTFPRSVGRIWESPGFIQKGCYLLSRLFPPRGRIRVLYGIPPNSARVYLYYFIHLRDMSCKHLPAVVKALLRNRKTTESLQISIKQNILLNWLRDGKRR